MIPHRQLTGSLKKPSTYMMRLSMMLIVFVITRCSSWGNFWQQETPAALTYSMLSNQSIAMSPLFPTLTTPLSYQLVSGGGTLDASSGVYSPGAFTGTSTVKATESTGRTATGTVIVTTYSAMTLAEPGLVFYFRMGEAAGNISNSVVADTATAGGSTITYSQAGAITGDANTAIAVNGGYFTTTASVNLSGQNVSVDVWVKRQVTGAFHTVFSHGTNTTGNGMHLAISNTNVLRYSLYGVDLDSPTASETDITAYHHYVVTYEAAATKRTIYKDGVEITSVNSPAYGYASPSSFRFGDYIWSAGGGPLNGVIDEMTIYVGSVLTPAQVLRHYRAGKGMLFN